MPQHLSQHLSRRSFSGIHPQNMNRERHSQRSTPTLTSHNNPYQHNQHNQHNDNNNNTQNQQQTQQIQPQQPPPFPPPPPRAQSMDGLHTLSPYFNKNMTETQQQHQQQYQHTAGSSHYGNSFPPIPDIQFPPSNFELSEPGSLDGASFRRHSSLIEGCVPYLLSMSTKFPGVANNYYELNSMKLHDGAATMRGNDQWIMADFTKPMNIDECVIVTATPSMPGFFTATAINGCWLQVKETPESEWQDKVLIES